jgi:transposase
MQYLGVDWSYRRAAWCALAEGGSIVGGGVVSADEDGLARLILRLGLELRAVVEMMSGAIWVRDQLVAAGWEVQVAHARKVRDVAPLACKTDKVDARVLAELCRRDLVPELWVPSLADRELRERLRRRMHLVRMSQLGDEPQLRAADSVGPAPVAAAAAGSGRDGAARAPRRPGGLATFDP